MIYHFVIEQVPGGHVRRKLAFQEFELPEILETLQINNVQQTMQETTYLNKNDQEQEVTWHPNPDERSRILFFTQVIFE